MELKKNKLITTLDIGNDKIGCCILQQNGNKNNILAYAVKATKGIKKGEITDISALSTVIASTVEEAEKNANIKVTDVIVGINLAAIQSHYKIVTVQINHSVTKSTVDDMIDQTLISLHNHETTILHYIPLKYKLDSMTEIINPYGMQGRNLSLELNIFTITKSVLKNIETCLIDARLDVTNLVYAPCATALGVLTDEEKEIGVSVIDIGASFTHILHYHHNKLVSLKTIPLGGANITHDIAACTNITIAEAERFKTLHGNTSLIPTDEHYDFEHIKNLDLNNLDTYTKNAINQIIYARVEEILQFIKKNFDRNFFNKKIVVTGGGALLVGIKEFSLQVLHSHIRIGNASLCTQNNTLPNALKSPHFSTLIGLIQFHGRDQFDLDDDTIYNDHESWYNNIYQKLLKILKFDFK